MKYDTFLTSKALQKLEEAILYTSPFKILQFRVKWQFSTLSEILVKFQQIFTRNKGLFSIVLWCKRQRSQVTFKLSSVLFVWQTWLLNWCKICLGNSFALTILITWIPIANNIMWPHLQKLTSCLCYCTFKTMQKNFIMIG